jgi:hypothetical protein
VIVVLVLRLFYVCEPTKLKRAADQILQRMYNVLVQEEMRYPEVIGACIELVDVILRDCGGDGFLRETAFVNFVTELLPALEPFQVVYRSLPACLFRLQQQETPFRGG